MHFKTLIFLALQTLSALAATNEPCYGPNSSPGVCVSTTACTASGGKSYKGACPGNTKESSPDPGSIQCCVKPKCSASGGATGACLWESDCGGKTTSNQCPGPSGFRCCSKPDSVFGTYKRPSLPTSGCKAVAEKGAKLVLDAWPGRVRAVLCGRKCSDPTSSDHCVGGAIDFLVSDAFMEPTIGGREIAEWVMHHRKELKLKYVIWGQRIWSDDTGSKDKVVGWPAWRNMERRDDINENHWNHVHVSFK